MTGEWRFWVPTIIAIAAACFTGLQWYEAHHVNVLLVRPSIGFYTQSDDTEPRVGIAIENNGPGPAVIKSVAYYVDRKPVRDADEAAHYGKLNADLIDIMEFDADDTLPVGRTPDWLFSCSTRNKRELDRFIDFVDQHLGVEVTYCSIDNDCWRRCSTKGRCK